MECRIRCVDCGLPVPVPVDERTLALKQKRQVRCSECGNSRIFTDGAVLATNGLLADLHKFARSLELRRDRFDVVPYPHYLMPGKSSIEAAQKKGARLVTQHRLMRIMREAGMVESAQKRRAS